VGGLPKAGHLRGQGHGDNALDFGLFFISGRPMDQPVMLITGASRGIGAVTATLAAQRGYAVAVNYVHNADAAQAVVDAITCAGGQAMAVQADVAREQDILRMFDTVLARWGRLDALVNNAGVLEQMMPVVTMTAARISRVMGTNVVGLMLCCREAVKHMATSHGGHGGAIVNVSSVAARLGSPFEYVDYAASKAAVDAITIGLAKEMATQGVRVNAVRPGLIYTEIHASGGDAKRVERLQGNVPMQRGGRPEEVAEAIVWLLSDAASYTTGSLLDVAGGR
jgi:NAD(P)-dependent dehydrogenase (short-subunit alcohol dehydrogenase family)